MDTNTNQNQKTVALVYRFGYAILILGGAAIIHHFFGPYFGEYLYILQILLLAVIVILFSKFVF